MNASTVRFLTAGLLLLVLASCPVLSQETQRQYLSGHGKDDAIPWKFFCTSGPQSGYWTNLPVPSNWELFGFGSMNYHKDPTNAWGEQGRYEREFTLPSRWIGQRVFLVFDGVMTDTSASLNGQSVGPMHQGGFYRFKYEVTGLLKFDATNLLEVTVAKHSANNSVNRAERTADYWVFGGIYRPVYLEAVPKQFIERVAIDARAEGGFSMEVFVNGVTNSATLGAQLFQLDGTPLGAPFEAKLAGPETTLKTRAASPRTWTSETPQLYRVEVRLRAGDQILHRYQQRFGFRTMEVRDGDGLYVNGRRMILKGANRHSFWPESGRCLSEAVHRLDINTMKDMNMNAVRMSHYPPDERFLELCDELGLYVLDELAGWHAFYDTKLGTKLVAEMVTRDVNHPCILFWDNGNEGGFNTNLDHLFPELDPQHRRVLHPWVPFNGINTSHYLTYEQATIACQGVPTYYRSGKVTADTHSAFKYIYMPTEFQHGLYDGGAGAGLQDTWELMLKSKYLGGGFIWAFLDDGAKRPDTGEIDVAGNQAPDGIVGPYRQREGSFYAIKETWSPIVVNFQADDPGSGQGMIGTLPVISAVVENRYSFTDASQCTFTWQLRKFHRPDEPAAGFEVVAEKQASPLFIPPGGRGELRLTIDRPAEALQRADALALRVDDPSGRELWTWVSSIEVAGRFQWPVSQASPLQPKAAETAEVFEIRAGELTVRISKQTGFLIGAQRASQVFSLSNGPRPAPGNATLISLKSKADGSNYLVKAIYDGDLKGVTWCVRGNGWLQCDYSYAAVGPRDFFGVAFDYPEKLVKRKRWLGDGPYRVWKNRLPGATFNIWENDYNNTITGWRDWIYPEFKGCFANVRWVQLETTEGLITTVVRPPAVDPGTTEVQRQGYHEIFVQVLTPEFPPANLAGKTVPALPQAGLAFLHAIPPIGNKFQEASKGGPRSQLNEAEGWYSGSIAFYFGKLP